MLPGETVSSVRPDFYADLERAIAHVEAREKGDLPNPLGHDPGSDLNRLEITLTESFRNYPDDAVIQLEELPGPDTVCTIDPDEYLALIEQATEVLHAHVSPDTTFVAAMYAETDADIVGHEKDHGREVRRFGNEDTIVYYGVVFSLDAEGGLEFQPHISHSGPLRKIHEAWSALAPSRPSDGDLEKVRALGYDPADRERIRRLAEATPPVEPGWRPPRPGRNPDLMRKLAEALRDVGSSAHGKQ